MKKVFVPKGKINKRNSNAQIEYAKKIIDDNNFDLGINPIRKWLLFAAEIGIVNAKKEVCNIIGYNNVQNDYIKAREFYISTRSDKKEVEILCEVAFLLYMLKPELYDNWFDMIIKYHKDILLQILIRH